jgi:hypothetical protein
MIAYPQPPEMDLTSDDSNLRHLRPCTSPELLDRMIHPLLNHFPTLGLLAALSALPNAFRLVSTEPIVQGPEGPTILMGPLLLALGLELGALLPRIALIVGLFLVFLRPCRTLRPLQLLRYALGRMPLILTAYVAMIIGVSLFGGVALSLRALGPVGTLLSTVMMVFGLYWAIRWMLTLPILVLEGRTILDSFRRSAYLTSVPWMTLQHNQDGGDLIRRPAYSRHFMLLAVLVIALVMVTQALFFLMEAQGASLQAQISLSVLTSFLNSLLVYSGLVALYSDALIRVEGWDLENRILAQEASIHPDGTSDPKTSSSPQIPSNESNDP